MTALADVWEAARTRWAEPILLSEPVVDEGVPLAQIDLEARRVRVNVPRIEQLGVEHALEAILAHEVGHHLRWPRDLATHARMTVLERSLIPLEGFSASNLFTDLLINEHLGAAYRDELRDVYAALAREAAEPPTDVFRFYLVIYEELWQLPAGALSGGPGLDAFVSRHPAYRAEAHVLAQDMFALAPDVYTQLVYFLSILMRYLSADAERAFAGLGCQCRGEPSADDWARALTLGPRERRALRRALREGWLSQEQVDRLNDRAFDRRVATLPGQASGAADRVPEIMAAWYRQTAQRYLIAPPPQRRWGEAVVATTLEPWEPGEPLTYVDWSATLREKGPVLAAAEPLARDVLADEEGIERPRWQPRMEIYLDVSGSMPDPRATRNAMTLAAQILAMGTLRAGGWVRALVYSTEPVKYWDWCRSSTEIARFLMHYIGAGTRFPFEVLAESAQACGRDAPLRVIITDGDFDANVDDDAARRLRLLAEATTRSAQLVLLLHGEPRDVHARYEKLGATVIHVRDMEDFPRVAADLSRALFDREVAA